MTEKASVRTRIVPALEDLSLPEKAALLSGKNVFETRDLPRLGLESAFLADGPHGVRKQLGSGDHLGIGASAQATCFPTSATVANSWDPELVAEVGQALGAECRALSVDQLLGPGLNIKRSPLCGRNFEYFSEDPYLAGKLAAAYVRGLQRTGVSATPKHFAVNSQEYRRMTNDSVVDERTLRELYLTAFEIVVREGRPRSIMTSYNRINGVYANENAFLLQEVLREEWGFDGAVVTDWGGGNDPVAAIRAGGTFEMPSPGFDSARQILDAVHRVELTEGELDVRVAEVLRHVSQTPAEAGETMDVEAHHDLARRAAEESVVLLKNDDGLLPLGSGTRVAVIGDFAETPRYQGAGSSLVNPTRVTTPMEALRASDLEIVAHAQGFRRDGTPDDELLAAATVAAAAADVVLVYLGLPEVDETEGRDRDHLRIPENQIDLLRAIRRANDRVVVVLSAGAVVEMPWLDHVTSLVHGYLTGQAGSAGVVNVLTGRVNPSGRLAETYPFRLADTPTYGNYPGEEASSHYREGLYVGYRYYSTADVAVRFPFGFGLSYTSFDYDDLEVTSEGATFTVRNSGGVAGAEVAQLYVARRGSGVLRPARELKGFAKLRLQPGEERRVTISFDEYAFRHFSVSHGGWQVETADYEILIGASVEDIRLRAGLRVPGTVEPESPRTDLPSYASGRVTQVSESEFAALLGRTPPARTRADGPLRMNSPLADLAHARSPLARGIDRLQHRILARADAKGAPDLDALFRLNMPFRAIAKMMNGTVSTPMAEAMLVIVNGRHVAGILELVRAWRANRRTTRFFRQQLDGDRRERS